jgi:hypothetical protein
MTRGHALADLRVVHRPLGSRRYMGLESRTNRKVSISIDTKRRPSGENRRAHHP